jgi:pyroglutamyl-peptidase
MRACLAAGSSGREKECMKKILVTGFQPFGGETMNPAWEAVRRLPDTIAGASVTKVEIPVVFGKGP